MTNYEKAQKRVNKLIKDRTDAVKYVEEKVLEGGPIIPERKRRQKVVSQAKVSEKIAFDAMRGKQPTTPEGNELIND